MFLVGAIGLVPISAFAQVYQITMKKSNASLSSVIAEIEKESGYTFFYNDDQINLGKKISIDVTDVSLDVVLNHMFKNTGYVYRIVNNQIVVSKSSEGGIARTSSVNTTQQQKSVMIRRQKYTIYLLNFNIKYQQSYFPKHQIRKTKKQGKTIYNNLFRKNFVYSFIQIKVFFLFLPIIISYYCKLHHKTYNIIVSYEKQQDRRLQNTNDSGKNKNSEP